MSWVVLALLAAAPTSASMLAADPSRPLSERLDLVSAKFLGTAYVASPLGEGTGKDPDPLVRYDAVDCLTFVEEAIALSLAPSADAGLPPIPMRLTALAARSASQPVRATESGPHDRAVRARSDPPGDPPGDRRPATPALRPIRPVAPPRAR